MSIDIGRRTAQRIVNAPTYSSKGEIVEIVEKAYQNRDTEWLPVKDEEANEGSVEIAQDAVQAITELISNSIDAYIQPYVEDFDSREEILEQVYDEVNILLNFNGYGNAEYSAIVADNGCGVGREDFEDAFLKNPSEGGIRKKEYDILNGRFAQGSLAAIGVSKQGCKFVASASESNPNEFMFSVTRYNEDRARYEYFVVDGEPPSFSGSLRLDGMDTLDSGTVTKIFDVDSEQTPTDFTSSPFIRTLGHSIPEPPVELNIVDNREGNGYNSIEWSGMKSKLDNRSHVRSKQIQTKTDNGFVDIHAYIADEEEGFSYDFATKDSSRIFYTVNGITHAEESKCTTENKCNINSIADNLLLFVDCSNLECRLNKIFMPSRDGMKSNQTASEFRQEIYETISGWEELQQIDKKRTSVEDVAEESSPISGVELTSSESLDGCEFVADFTLNSDYPNYAEHENLEYSVFNADRFTVETEQDSVTVRGVADKSQLMLRVSDTQYGETYTSDFSVTIPEKENGIESINSDKQRVAVEGSATVNLDVEHSDEEFWMSDSVDVDVNAISGELETYSVEKNENGLQLTVEPKLPDSDEACIVVVVDDGTNQRKEDIILEKSTTNSSDSLESLVEKYGTDEGSINIGTILNKMSEDERELVAGMKKSQIENLFNIRETQRNYEKNTEDTESKSWTPKETGKMLDKSTEEIRDILGIEKNTKVPFKEGDPAVHNIVNALLCPYGFKQYSKGQFERIAGGSAKSADKIENYADNVNGYTYIDDIISYCKKALENSIWVSKDVVSEEVETAEDWVESNSIYSGNRTDTGTIHRIASGFVAEQAMKKHAQEHGLEITLNRDKYDSRQHTDGGIDVDRVNGQEPPHNIQIKDIQSYLLVEVNEFFQKEADTYVGYQVHTPNERTFAAGDTGVRVIPHGWADEDELRLQPKDVSGEKYNLSFDRDNNMSLPRCQLNPMEELFDQIKSELRVNTKPSTGLTSTHKW